MSHQQHRFAGLFLVHKCFNAMKRSFSSSKRAKSLARISNAFERGMSLTLYGCCTTFLINDTPQIAPASGYADVGLNHMPLHGSGVVKCTDFVGDLRVEFEHSAVDAGATDVYIALREHILNIAVG